MSNDLITVKVFRFDPSVDKEPYYKTYEVPFEEGMSGMDVLDYIYQNQDGTLAYYDHAGCSLGICGRCTGKMNGQPGLICQTRVEGNVTFDPLDQKKVLKDLVITREAPRPKETAAETGGTVMQDINSVPMIIRREIEALIAVPLIKAFIEKFGREPALEVTREVLKSLSRQAGKLLQVVGGGNGMEHLQRALPLFSQGGALEYELLEATPVKTAINVTRCKYAEMYREYGLEEFGFLLSCGRDFALMEGLNPKIRFTRTQTLMEGADFCDFRFSSEEE
ncbi:MAG TPA: L-2-amino-thiazoline-4-carboxylic acid hydrolase [Desulfomonilaceae bacterium]|nr:L-2-amino-thiazoline-4-carboxylic acid hydrolase [Desulfomonilaceae bacterium]